MTGLTEVADLIQKVLGPLATEAVTAVKLKQRASKVDGTTLIQGIVAAVMDKPSPTVEDYTAALALRGIEISPQAMQQWLTHKVLPQALRLIVEGAASAVVRADPVAVALMGRFNGVYVQDSTVMALPDVLAAQLPGCGGDGSAAALKLQVRWNLSTGQLAHLELQAGRDSDQSSAMQHERLPAGALRLADLGYFSLAVLQQMSADGVWWLTRHNLMSTLFTAAEDELDLMEFLRDQAGPVVDQEVRVGASQHLRARLIAVRVPQEVADQRRARLYEEAQKKSRTPSARSLALANWTILLTHLMGEHLSVTEALVLLKARWQIELLFKLWKQTLGMAIVDSANPHRILSELYAKLIAMLIQHWVMLLSCWERVDRSLVKAFTTLRKFTYALFRVLSDRPLLIAVLTDIQRTLRATARQNKRRAKPATCQLLLDPDLLGWLDVPAPSDILPVPLA